MDLGNIIYIIAIIAYFIYTATKKKANPEEIDQPGSPDSTKEQRKPMSFEDLLKEIRQGQGQPQKESSGGGQSKPAGQNQRPQEGRTFEQPKPKPVQESKKIKRYESYEGVIEERKVPDRIKLADQERIHSHVEGIKSTISVESIDGLEEENKYKTMLRNPNTIKDAVILSEILNRRYF